MKPCTLPRRLHPFLLLAPLLLLASASFADVYTLGSSYTWDTRPYDLDEPTLWHIDCGRSLLYIHDNPSTPCIGTSTPWPTALSDFVFDAISFQPVPEAGITIWDDLFSIYDFLRDQPDAMIVIHQTWPVPGQWEAAMHQLSTTMLADRSMVYGYVLVDWLKAIHPDRTIVLTRSNEMLDWIYHDCATTGCPALAQRGRFFGLFRDGSGHMSATTGSYLQHNALRAALGQPVGVQSPIPVERVSPAEQAYLDDVVMRIVPEPPGGASLGSGALLAAVLARRRRRLVRGVGCAREIRAELTVTPTDGQSWPISVYT